MTIYPKHHTELAAAANIVFSAKWCLCKMFSIFDLKHTGITILVKLKTTRDPEGRSRIENSLKYGLFSYKGHIKFCTRKFEVLLNSLTEVL